MTSLAHGPVSVVSEVSGYPPRSWSFKKKEYGEVTTKKMLVNV